MTERAAVSMLIRFATGKALEHLVCVQHVEAPSISPATRHGVQYEFEGEIGLAPGWASRALQVSEQRWISACLLARVNAHGQSVEISMRGAHPALTVPDEEAARWSLEEGAFWGNLFVPEDQPLDWNACTGQAQSASEAGDLAARDCAEPDPAHPDVTQCGFRYAGACARAAHQVAACASVDGQYYDACGAADAPFAEVITTFVRP